MSAQHTPGPWSVDQQSHRGMAVVIGPDGEHIAYVTGETVAQQLRDARAIAALPELLRAAANALAHNDAGRMAHGAGQFSWGPDLRAAIAKATGAASS